MKKRNMLQTLVFQSGLTQQKFADAVGVKLRTLEAQLKRKETLELTYNYMKFLGINSIKGYECGCYIQLEYDQKIREIKIEAFELISDNRLKNGL